MKLPKDRYRVTRFLYILEAAFEYFISLLLTGAYVAKVAGALGLSDSVTGMITSIASLGCGFQFFAIFLAHKTPVKRWVTAFHILNQLLFVLVWLTPLFQLSKVVKTVLFITFLLTGYAFNHLVNSPKINWYMSLVDDGKRGRFTAYKEMVSLCGGTVFTYLMGTLFDDYEEAGRHQTAFLLGATTLLVLAVLHTLTLIGSKEKPTEKKTEHITLREVGALFRNKNLMTVVWIGVLYQFANGISYSYYGTYQINELGFSMSFVALLNIGYTVVRCICSIILGRYADKHSFSDMLRISFGALICGEILMIFTVPANGKLLYTLFYVVFYAFFSAGFGNGVMNLTYNTVEKSDRMSAFAIYNCVSGIVGFLASIPGSVIVSAVQKQGNCLFGYPVYAQQLLSMLAVIILAILWLFMKKAFRN